MGYRGLEILIVPGLALTKLEHTNSLTFQNSERKYKTMESHAFAKASAVNVINIIVKLSLLIAQFTLIMF